MKNNAWTIAKKDIYRFFCDKRLILTVIVFPGLLIYLLYSVMGMYANRSTDKLQSYMYNISICNSSSIISNLANTQLNFTTNQISISEIETETLKIAEKEIDLLIIFPNDFDMSLIGEDLENRFEIPKVKMFYNSTSTKSEYCFEIFSTILSEYENSLLNKYDVVCDDLAEETTKEAMIYASLLPALMIVFLLSSCMSIAPESIAGEKERGTLSTILVTPINRKELAIGKILGLSILAIISACSSFVGLVLSLPKLINQSTLNVNLYTLKEYILLLLIMVTTVIFIIALFSVISAFARTIKEANTEITPFTLIGTLISVTTMYTDETRVNSMIYLIPIFNSAQSLNNILSKTYNTGELLTTILSNLFYAVLFTIVLTRMFNSEKIIG